jgi:hypothetical protein
MRSISAALNVSPQHVYEFKEAIDQEDTTRLAKRRAQSEAQKDRWIRTHAKEG